MTHRKHRGNEETMKSDHHSLPGAGNPHSPAPSSRVRFNLNGYIWFRPILPIANEFLAEEAKRIARPYAGTPHHQKVIDIFMRQITPDADGWCKMQGWEFMNTFGPGMIPGSPALFERMEVEIEPSQE